MRGFIQKILNYIFEFFHIKKRKKDSNDINNDINIMSCNIKYIKEKKTN